MAGFSFLSNMLPTALSAMNAVNSVRRTTQNAQVVKQTYQMAQDEYAAKQADLAKSLSNQQQKNQITSEQDSIKRRDALRRAMARQRAAFGAQGIDSSDGSAEAILLGLSQQSDLEQAQQDTLDRLRNAALQDDAATQSRKNLLELNKAYDRARLSALYSD
jgi:hypothetical protein